MCRYRQERSSRNGWHRASIVCWYGTPYLVCSFRRAKRGLSAVGIRIQYTIIHTWYVGMHVHVYLQVRIKQDTLKCYTDKIVTGVAIKVQIHNLKGLNILYISIFLSHNLAQYW